MSFTNWFTSSHSVQLPSDSTALPSTTRLAGEANPPESAFYNPFRSLQITNPFIADIEAQSQDTDPSWFNLSYFERISMFIICLIGSYSCYAICFFLFPVLSLRPKKFALLWSLGSLFFLSSFVVLNGPTKFFRHASSLERLPFSISFISSIAATLTFSLIWKNNLLVIIACVLQAVCSIWYTVSYFPYGRQGLQLTTGVARNQVENWLNG